MRILHVWGPTKCTISKDCAIQNSIYKENQNRIKPILGPGQATCSLTFRGNFFPTENPTSSSPPGASWTMTVTVWSPQAPTPKRQQKDGRIFVPNKKSTTGKITPPKKKKQHPGIFFTEQKNILYKTYPFPTKKKTRFFGGQQQPKKKNLRTVASYASRVVGEVRSRGFKVQGTHLPSKPKASTTKTASHAYLDGTSPGRTGCHHPGKPGRYFLGGSKPKSGESPAVF